MKNIKSLSLFALLAIGALFLSNCGPGTDDPDPVPLLNFIADSAYISSDATLSAGQSFTIAVTASHSEKLKSLTVTKAVDGGAAILEVDSTYNDEVIALYEYNGTVGTTAGDEVYTFTVIDKDGISSSKSITITNLGSGGLDLIYLRVDNDDNTFKVYNFKGPELGAYELGGGPLSISDPDSQKDIQDDTETGEAWPARWTSRNGSTFKKVDGGAWNTIINDATIEAAWDAAGTEASIINLSESDVYLINIKGSDRLGMILITALDQTVLTKEFAEFEYKYQQI